MKPMDDRIRDELGRVVESYVPSPGLPERIEARTRQRERNRVRLLLGATATSVALVAGLVLVTRGGSGRTTTIASGTPSLPSTSAAPLSTTPAVRAPVSVATPTATAPRSFLAAVGGGNEQAVIIDTASGRVTRTLAAAPPGQLLWAVSVDGRTLYAPTQELACARKYVAVDTATGAALGPAFAGLSDLQSVAPSPDGQTIAYTTGCPPSGGANGADNNVYIRRPDLSTTTLATAGRGLQMSWSGDATMLAVDVLGPTRALQLWDIGPTSASGPRTIAAPDAGCELMLPRFAGNQLFVTEECPSASSSASQTVRLLLLDTVSGSVGRSWTLATAPNAMVADLAVDPTGGWALYSLNTDKVNGQVSVLALSPAAAKPRVLLNDAFEVAWLPAATPPAPAVVPTTVFVPPTGTTVPSRTGTTVPTGPTVTEPPTSTPTSIWLPSCGFGAPTTPYFPNGCILPDGSIQPPL